MICIIDSPPASSHPRPEERAQRRDTRSGEMTWRIYPTILPYQTTLSCSLCDAQCKRRQTWFCSREVILLEPLPRVVVVVSETAEARKCPCQQRPLLIGMGSPRWQRTLHHRGLQKMALNSSRRGGARKMPNFTEKIRDLFDFGSSSAAPHFTGRRHHPNHHRRQVASLTCCKKMRWRVEIESRSQ